MVGRNTKSLVTHQHTAAVTGVPDSEQTGSERDRESLVSFKSQIGRRFASRRVRARDGRIRPSTSRRHVPRRRRQQSRWQRRTSRQRPWRTKRLQTSLSSFSLNSLGGPSTCNLFVEEGESGLMLAGFLASIHQGGVELRMYHSHVSFHDDPTA
jgi:hypothetical protein